MKRNQEGFTLIELLVVIAIIGLLSTISVLALNSARARSRDAKRVSDIKQIQTALEMYYNDTNDYPASLSFGTGSIATGSNIYMKVVPKQPEPNDGDCTTAENTYTYTKTTSSNGTSVTYGLTYCLGASINGIPAGVTQTASPAGIR